MKEYFFLNKYVDQFQNCNIFNEEIKQISKNFNSEFTEINCEIQSSRLENDDLIDEYLGKQFYIQKTEKEILEKANLINMHDNRVKKNGQI